MCLNSDIVCWGFVDNVCTRSGQYVHMNGRKRDDDQHVLSDDGVMSYDVGTTKSITLLGYAFDLVVHRITVSGLMSVVL